MKSKDDVLEDLSLRQLGRSTSIQNTSELYPPSQWSEESLENLVNEVAVPVVTVKYDGDKKKKKKNYKRHPSTTVKIKARRKEISSSGLRVRQKDSRSRIPRTAIRQVKSRPGNEGHLSVLPLLRQKKKDDASQVWIVGSSISAKLTSLWEPSVSPIRQCQDLDKAGDKSMQILDSEKTSFSRKTEASEDKGTKKKSFHWPTHDGETGFCCHNAILRHFSALFAKILVSLLFVFFPITDSSSCSSARCVVAS